MVDIQTVSVVIASAGVLVGIAYYLLEMKHQTRIRQTDLVMRLYSAISSKEFYEAWEKFKNREIKSMEDYSEKYGTVEFNQVMSVYTEVGVLLQRKLIDTSIVEDLFGDSVQRINEKIGHLDPMVYDNTPFKYLYNEVKKREQQLSRQRKG